jgi:hypothetical protein
MRSRVVFKRGLLCCAGPAICMLTSSPRGLVIFVLLAVVAFYVQRALCTKNRRSGGNRFAFFPTYTSAGNAFQQLQMLAEPRTEHVIQEKAIDQAEEDDEGEPEDETNLTHQLRQIRNGDRSSKLVVSRVPGLAKEPKITSPKNEFTDLEKITARSSR